LIEYRQVFPAAAPPAGRRRRPSPARLPPPPAPPGFGRRESARGYGVVRCSPSEVLARPRRLHPAAATPGSAVPGHQRY